MDALIDESCEPADEVRAAVTLWLAGDELEACLRIARLSSDQRAHFAAYCLRQLSDVLEIAAAGTECSAAGLWQRLLLVNAQQAAQTT